jgi:hypothetical protein
MPTPQEMREAIDQASNLIEKYRPILKSLRVWVCVSRTRNLNRQVSELLNARPITVTEMGDPRVDYENARQRIRGIVDTVEQCIERHSSEFAIEKCPSPSELASIQQEARNLLSGKLGVKRKGKTKTSYEEEV